MGFYTIASLSRSGWRLLVGCVSGLVYSLSIVAVALGGVASGSVGMAINNTGNALAGKVYATDFVAGAVDRFGPNGEPEASINKFGSTAGLAETFTTESVPPEIAGQEFTSASDHGARITAQINPQGLPGSYRAEYSTSPLTPKGATLTTTTHYASVGSFAANVELEGLLPDTQYYYRLTATNTSNETTYGIEGTLRTLPAATGMLPDERVYEMVTPTNNADADVHVPLAVGLLAQSQGVHTALPFAVATSGEAVTYPSDPTSGGFGRGVSGLGNQYIAHHQSGGGWRQINIQPAARSFTYYKAFSSSLGIGILTSGGEMPAFLPPLSVEAPGESYNVLYSCAISIEPCAISGAAVRPAADANLFYPLYGKPLNRKAEATAAKWGTRENGHPVFVAGDAAPRGEAIFAGASSSFRDLFFEADDALPDIEGAFGSELEENVLDEISKSESNDYLYERSDGGLSVVDVLPEAQGGRITGNATFGAPPFPEESSTDQPNFTRAISEDGSRAFWTDLNTDTVYVRVNQEATVQVSAGKAPARYWTASVDGRYVFYTEEGSLYRFSLDSPGGQERLELAGAESNVLGVIGASESGSSVYFVAEGILTSKGNSEGIKPTLGSPNLYLWNGGQSLIYVATLSSADGRHIQPYQVGVTSSRGEYGDWLPGTGQRTARISGNGESMVFMSDQPLASAGFPQGYPNHGLEEVYLYSAGSNSLFCVSCSPSGESPPASEDEAAAFLPISWAPTYLPQWISEDGDRVFFNSLVPLVAQDTNGSQDVYEWEREGTGTCRSDSSVNGGCLYVLSGGDSLFQSWLLGASASGNDVFVITRAQLAPEDQNETFDLFDARVDGEQRPTLPACTGTGCQGAAAGAPVFATPPSATFTGLGNFSGPQLRRIRPKHTKAPSNGAQHLKRALKKCRKEHGRDRRAVCEDRAHRRYGKPTSARSDRVGPNPNRGQ